MTDRKAIEGVDDNDPNFLTLKKCQHQTLLHKVLFKTFALFFILCMVLDTATYKLDAVESNDFALLGFAFALTALINLIFVSVFKVRSVAALQLLEQSKKD